MTKRKQDLFQTRLVVASVGELLQITAKKLKDVYKLCSDPEVAEEQCVKCLKDVRQDLLDQAEHINLLIEKIDGI